MIHTGDCRNQIPEKIVLKDGVEKEDWPRACKSS